MRSFLLHVLIITSIGVLLVVAAIAGNFRRSYGVNLPIANFLGGGPTSTPTTMCTPENIILDGGFETGGIPSTIWNNPQSSTNFGTPLCDNPSCGTGNGTAPPRTGAIWSWFGGAVAPETATLGQNVTIPTGTASLHF